jgi:nicotinamide mononucleotide adenylyltransferase
MNPLYEKDSTSMASASIDDYNDEDKSNQASNKDIKKRKDSKKDQDSGKGIIKKDTVASFDAEKYVDTEPRINEALDKKAVITFGRMNPPTVGHEKLLNKMIKTAIDVKGTPLVYLSKTQDAKKNPLSYNDKIKFAQLMFGKKYVIKSEARTIIEVAKELQKKYSDLVIVVGSDRVREFDTLLNKYNGKEYQYNSIEVVSAGERDPDSEGVDGMSASKMRALAVDGDMAEFSKGVPSTNNTLVKSLYTAVRKGLGIREAMNNAVDQFMAERVKAGKVDPLSAMGKQKLTGAEVSDYYKKNPIAKAAAARDKNVKLGIELALDLSGNMNYAVKEVDKLKKNLSKHPEVQKALRHANESVNPTLYKAASFQERLKIEDEKSKQQKQQPGYYKDMAGSTADKRQAQFNKQTDMDDNDPEAYKPAPGDASAETKPSKHSNKFKKMFGESVKPNMERAGLKRPHKLLRQDNTVNFDYRFKMYTAAKELDAAMQQRAAIGQQVTEQRISEIETIMEQAEFVNEASNPEKSLKDKAKKSGMPYGILKKVFDRGVAAWRTGHRPGTTPVQWGLARVNSFATKSSGTWGKADKDLADKVNG